MLQRSIGSVGGRFGIAGRICAALIVIACPHAGTATAASIADAWPSPPAERPSSCPDPLMLEPAGDNTYLFAVDAKASSTKFLDVIFFTANAAYEIRLPEFRIDRPLAGRADMFRSAGVLVKAPAGEPFLGASLASVGTACGAAHTLAPSIADGFHPADRQASSIASVRRDAIPAVGAVVATRVAGSTAQPCAQPFQAARPDHVLGPEYPEIARQQGAEGTAVIRVDVDARGKVTGTERYESSGNTGLDEAAIHSVYASSYFPAIFACRPDAGSLTLPVTFTIRS